MKIVNCDALDYLRDTPSVRTIWVDPPDNLGLGYDNYLDKRTDKEYQDWLELLCHLALPKCQIFWISYYHKHDLWLKAMLFRLLRTRFPSREARTIIWSFKFGQYSNSDLTSSFRPILRIHTNGFKFDWSKVKDRSVRQELGDPRASGDRLPGDVWEYPRVAGNFEERRDWHPTQHPISLCGRVALISGGPLIDLCGGTGSMLRACLANQIECTYVDQSEKYCQLVSKELNLPVTKG
jgi:hypothetical protein